MDLEYAVEDCGCTPLMAASCHEALALIGDYGDGLTVAVLDVSLGEGSTCLPVARELARRGVPFILHSGDLDRHDEAIRELNADLIAKPAPSDQVIAGAIAYSRGIDPDGLRVAAE